MGLFLEGLAWGVGPVFFVGPVLFTLLDASLQGGFRAGARVALGIAVSDVVAIALCALGLGPVLTHPMGEQVLGVVGGVILAGFGLALALKAHQVDTGGDRKAVAWPFWAGFAVNFVNPFVFSFWVAMLASVGTRHGWSAGVFIPVFGGMVSVILATDLLKAGAASALSRHLTGPVLVWARRVSGGLLVLAGLGVLLRPLYLRALAPLLES